MKRFARLVKQLVFAAVFVAFFGGIIRLLIFVGWPLPRHWPSTHQWIAWLNNDQPLITTRFLIDVGACVMWLVVGGVFVMVLLDAVGWLRWQLQHWHLHIPVRRQGFFSGLIGAFVLGAGRTTAAAHGSADAAASAHAATAAAAATPAAGTDENTQWTYTGQSSYTAQSSYTVQPGDTLWDIAQHETGDPLRYHQIAADNQGRAEPDGQHFTDPDLIYPGWKLTIPDTAHDAPTAPPPRHPSTHRPSPYAHAAPPTGTPPTTGAPSPAATSRPSDTPSAAPDRIPASQPTRGSDGRISLPGGSLIGIPLAMAVSAALAAVAVLRWRRRYRPQAPDADQPPASPPMPPMVDHLNAALQTASQDVDNADADTDIAQVAEQDPDNPSGELAETGRLASNTDQAAARSLVRLDRQAPLILSGPYAPDAARGLLLAALTGRHPLVVTRAFADRVLAGTGLDGLPGLQVADTLDTALTALDLHLIATAGTTNESDEPPTDTAPHHQPALILFATDIPDHHRPRLAALISQPHLGAVLLPTHVEPDTLNHPDPAVPGPAPGQQLDLVSLDDALAILHDLRPAPPAPGTGTSSGSAAEPDADNPPDTTPDQQTPPVAGPARVRLLGSPTILMPDGAPAEGLRDRAATILTYLAVHRRTGAGADELQEATGLGRIRRTSASQRLYTDISNLRSVLAAAAGDTSTNPRRYIVRTHGRYHIDPTRVDIDLWQLHDAISQATTATNPNQRHTALQTAVDTYTGDLAHGIDYLWAVEARETALADALNAATALADHYASTDPHHALALLTTAIGWSPYAETLYQRAMRLHAHLGDTAAIRVLFTTLATRLRDLETTPSPDTRQLATTLLHQHHDTGSPVGSADP